MTDRAFIRGLASRLEQTEPYVGAVSDLKPAAVLVLLYPVQDELFIPLIKRPEGQGHHGGQLALPGGRREPGDPSLRGSALREANEEVGLRPESVEVLGMLPSVDVTVSGHRVFPFVAWSSTQPTLILREAEVQSIVVMPVSLLLDPAALKEVRAPEGSRHRTYYEFELDGLRLWGATARMLVSLGKVLDEVFCNGAPQ